MFVSSLCHGVSLVLLYTTIIQQDAAVRSQFYFTAVLLQRGRVRTRPCWRKVAAPVPEAVDTVDILLMMGAESTRNV